MYTVALLIHVLAGANPAPPSAPAPESVASLRARATKLYRAKKYDQACPLFEQAAKLAPKDGAVLADWGLCLQRWGKEKEALAADLRALLASNGDPKTRANVYYNLAAFHDVTPPEFVLGEMSTPRGYVRTSADNPCAEIPSTEPSCTSKLYACVEQRGDGESWGCFRLWVFRNKAEGEAEWNKSDPEAKLLGSATSHCVPAPAPTQPASPPKQALIAWGSEMDPYDPCAAGDAACSKAFEGAELKRPGDCKIIYANPCAGRLGVACGGLPFMSRKALLKGASPGSKDEPDQVGEVNLQPPE